MNVVVLKGRLCADPEKRITQNGISQTSVNLAVQREYRDKTTGKAEADFIRIVAWRQSADFLAKYGQKGDTLAVRGTLSTRTYEKNGEKRYATEVIADRVELDKKPRSEGADAAQDMPEPGAEPPANTYDDGDDPLPF